MLQFTENYLAERMVYWMFFRGRNFVSGLISTLKSEQEAQLPQRDSASATHVFLGSLTDRALHWAPHLFYNYIID